MPLLEIQQQLRQLANPELAQFLQRFFKTGPGEYAAGDQFLGIKVPGLRRVVKHHRQMPLEEIECLLQSPWHEERLAALLILVQVYSKAAEPVRKNVYDLYLRHTRFINNWDLVDASAGQIVGAHLFTKSRKPLYRLVRSKQLWERRIAVIATGIFIREHDFTETLRLVELLLGDREDLIHKAAGWMLREVGKRDLKTEEAFLTQHYRSMPRTMLRYAIERFPQAQRVRYLRGEI
jgi:3-methyladenine DNA glycosylase AlkD